MANLCYERLGSTNVYILGKDARASFLQEIYVITQTHKWVAEASQQAESMGQKKDISSISQHSDNANKTERQ